MTNGVQHAPASVIATPNLQSPAPGRSSSTPTERAPRKPPSAKQLAWRKKWGEEWSAEGRRIKAAHEQRGG